MLTDRELQTMRNDGGFSEEAADELERLRETVKNLCESAKLAVHYHAAEIDRLREQLHLAEVARAAQVDGLAQGAAGWRERSEQLAAEVAGLREALLQCGESLSIFDVRSIVRGALAAGKGEAFVLRLQP